jgi:hypothetical protein
MAGFYYVVMVLMLGLFGIVAATIVSITLLVLASKRLPKGIQGRLSFLTACGFAPFVGLLWILIALLIHVQISNKLAHQDYGFSGDPYVTLPNGYILGSANTYDGYIRAQGFNTDTSRTGPGYVRSLIDIQWTGEHFVGTFSDGGNKELHFDFNTRDRSIQTVDTGILVNFEQVQSLVHQDANSYWLMYETYRHHWPNYILTILIITGEATIALWLRTYWVSMRRRAAKA